MAVFYRFSFLLLISILCIFSAVPIALAENRALIIGVGQYRLSSANLRGIELDVNMMKKTAGYLGFRDSQIKVLLDEEATLDNIKQAIESWLVDGVSSKDRVLFYFSGHGSNIPDQNGDEDDSKDEVLLPHDFRASNETLTNTFVDDVFGKILAKIPSKEVFVFIDACHSGTATKSIDLVHEEYPKFFEYEGMPKGISKSNFAAREKKGKDNYAGLSACQDRETAIATPEGSLFTRGVYETVKKASSGSRNLTLNQLSRKAGQFIENQASPDRVHHPQTSGNKRLADKNIFLVTASPPPFPEPVGIWAKLEQLSSRADYKVGIKINKTRFKVNDLLKITCNPERDGYINILNVSPMDKKATVLFPNDFHKDNFVRGGTTVRIPSSDDNFELPASPPLGKSMIVVFQTKEKINTFKKGIGNSEDLFMMFSDNSYKELKDVSRGFGVKRKTGGLGAGKVVAIIER